MGRHGVAVLLFVGVVLTLFIVAIVNGWYLPAAAIVLFALFGGGVWVTVIARVEGQPSEEDKEHPTLRRPHYKGTH